MVVCNADEGEPGTFKDRLLLGRHADLVLEGMTVAAYGIGASQGFIYLRGEYRYLLDALQATLERRRRDGLLGKDICGQAGFDFDVQVHVGAGSYVCGEASALVESLEGKRGIPRNRPPRLAEKGYLGSPHHRQQRRELLRRRADPAARRRLVPLARHGAFVRHQAALRVG